MGNYDDKLTDVYKKKKIKFLCEEIIPWFHIVVLIPRELPCSHEPHPDKNSCKTQFPRISQRLHQISCDIKSATCEA